MRPMRAVHHVGRRDDVDAGGRLGERLLHQRVERHIIDDVARRVDDAVLAVRGIGVEGDVGHDAELGKAFLQRRDRARHQPFGIECFLAVGALQPLLDGRKKRERGNAKLEALFGERQEACRRSCARRRASKPLSQYGFSRRR